MIPASFDYVVADSSSHALALLAEHGEDAKLLAGGHSLLPMMKVRLAQPTVLIDIARVAGLSGITTDGDEIVIGATTRHAELASSPVLRAEAPVLAYAAAQVGDPQIRHRGTIGGSVAHADPSADLPMTLLALGATIEITGADGTRAVGIDDFFTGPFESALGPDELPPGRERRVGLPEVRPPGQ
jgi:carbon-monoxide dehydrogenase medium subunit